MKKSVLAAILLALASAVPIPAMAGVNVNVGISLPPLIAFSSPPEVLVIPETTGVYVVPDIEDELFFLERLVVAAMGWPLVQVTCLQQGLGILQQRTKLLL